MLGKLEFHLCIKVPDENLRAVLAGPHTHTHTPLAPESPLPCPGPWPLLELHLRSAQTDVLKPFHWQLFQRILVRFPAPKWWLATFCTFSSKVSNATFHIPQIPDMPLGAHTYMKANYTYTQSLEK